MAVSKFAVAALAVFAVFNLNTEAYAGHGPRHVQASCPELNSIDPDNDGKMTLGEAFRAAKKKFNRLNVNRDRWLDARELVGVMPPKAIEIADTIRRNGKISKLEYLRVVKLAFKHANPDRDRTVNCQELLSKQGRPLRHLLM